MKVLKLFFLLFPLIATSQNKFDVIREQLKQNNKYEYVYGFENNYAVFRTFNNKMGVIDSTENVVIKPVFSFIHNNKELENLFEVGNKINKDFKRGFIDLKGNIRIPIIYDHVFYLGKGLISVTKDNKSGVLDTLNNIILPIRFDYIFTNTNLLVARTKSTSKLYDFKGVPISNLEFTDISNFNDNKAIITFQNKSTAIIDNLGNIVLKPLKNYSFKEVLNDDLFLIKNNLNSKEGVINSKGDFIIQCKYEEIKQVKSFFIAKSNGKKGFISITDSIVKPLIYDEIYFTYNDDAVFLGDNNLQDNYIVQKNKLYGVINPNVENDIIPLRYKDISTLTNKYFIIQNAENVNGLYTANGEKVLAEEYHFYNVFQKAIFATKNNKPFLIVLEDAKYSEKEVAVDAFVKFKGVQELPKNGNQIFQSNGKFGVINYENNVVIPCEYELIENIYLSNEFVVKKNNRYGIVNSENKVVVNLEFDQYEMLHETILFTKEKRTIKKYHGIKYR